MMRLFLCSGCAASKRCRVTTVLRVFGGAVMVCEYGAAMWRALREE